MLVFYTELQREENSILVKNYKDDDDLAEGLFGMTNRGSLTCTYFLRTSWRCDLCLCQLSNWAILGMIYVVKAHQNSSSLFLYRTTATQIVVLAARLAMVETTPIHSNAVVIKQIEDRAVEMLLQQKTQGNLKP